MAKSSPDKLAEALRANLRRRKAAPVAPRSAPLQAEGDEDPENPAEKPSPPQG